jgi:hypothetical protein
MNRRGYRIRAMTVKGALYLHKQVYPEEKKRLARLRMLELKRNAEFLGLRADSLEIVAVERARAMRLDDDRREGEEWREETSDDLETYEDA